MPQLPPVDPATVPDDVAKTLGRVREMFGSDEIPEPFLVYGHVEPFLRDFYMNFKKFVYTDGPLDAKTKAAVALSVAAHGKSKVWQEFLERRCVELGFEERQVAEILAIAATNYMYNTFFKFRELSGSDRFSGMGVGLRAHTFSSTSLDHRTVELINIAISDLNACKPCVSGHVEKARQLGLTDEQILEAIQCAATMYAGVQFLNSAMSAV